MLIKSNLVRLLAFGVALSALAGCGGSSTDRVTPSGGTINFAGGEVTEASPTTTTTVPAQGGVIVSTTDAETGDVVIPSGVPDAAITPNTTLAIIPAGFGFTGAFTPAADLVVNGVTQSGARIGTDGLLDRPVGLPVTEAGTSYVLAFPAGTLDTETRALTVQRFEFSGTFYLRNFGIVSPLPTSLAGRLPNNGENAVGASVTASFNAGNDGRTATLTVDYGTGFVLQRTVVITNGVATFDNLMMDSQNVPETGVQTVRLDIGNL